MGSEFLLKAMGQVADVGSLSVLWLIKGLGPGGAEKLLSIHAALGSPSVAYEVAYLLAWKDHLVAALAGHGVAAHCLRGGAEWDLRWAWRLRRLLISGRFDVLHTHSPYPAAVARMVVATLPRKRRPALVATEHNQWPRYSRLTRLATRVTYRRNQLSLCVSEAARDSMPRSMRRRVIVANAGIELAKVRAHGTQGAEIRRSLGIEADDVVMGTAANYRVQKAYPDLFQAALAVRRTQPAARFVCMGQGPLDAELQALHAELDLGSTLRLLGFRSDVLAVLAACDVFVLSSLHEGLPVALMEAMALGLPVVATSVGGIPEAVRHGVEGLLVPPGRPDLLAAAIAQLVDDPAMRRRMGAAALTRSEHFGAAPTIAKLEDHYRAVARLRPALV